MKKSHLFVLLAGALLFSACTNALGGDDKGTLTLSFMMPDYSSLATRAVDEGGEAPRSAARVISAEATHIQLLLNGASGPRFALAGMSQVPVEGAPSWYRRFRFEAPIPATSYSSIGVQIQVERTPGNFWNLGRGIYYGEGGTGISVAAGASIQVPISVLPQGYWNISSQFQRQYVDRGVAEDSEALAPGEMRFFGFPAGETMTYQAKVLPDPGKSADLYIFDQLGRLVVSAVDQDLSDASFAIPSGATGTWFLGVHSVTGGGFTLSLQGTSTTIAEGPVINEISLVDYANVEIANPSLAPLSMKGWKLVVRGMTSQYSSVQREEHFFYPEQDIPAGGFLVVSFRPPWYGQAYQNSNRLDLYDPTPSDATNGDAQGPNSYRLPQVSGAETTYYFNFASAKDGSGYYRNGLNIPGYYAYTFELHRPDPVTPGVWELVDYVRFNNSTIDTAGTPWPAAASVRFSGSIMARLADAQGLPADTDGPAEWARSYGTLGAANNVTAAQDMGLWVY